MLFDRLLPRPAARSSAESDDFATAVADLYREAAPFALSKTTYLVGRRDVAEEIVQDVFLKLWHKRMTFPSVRQAYGWIYTACHNAGIDHLRSRRLAVAAAAVPDDPLRPPDGPADRAANQQILAVLIGRLSEREARIVAYRFIDGLQLEDIATRMQLTERTVRRSLAAIQARHKGLWRSGDEQDV